MARVTEQLVDVTEAVRRDIQECYIDELNDNCKESSYIAGLSFLAVIIIVLVATILVFIRRYYELVEEMRSLQYSAITRISPQLETDAKEGHQYQELRIEDNSYHNLTLRN